MENANWKITLNAFAKKSRKAPTLTADCANSTLVDDYLLKTTFHKSYTSFFLTGKQVIVCAHFFEKLVPFFGYL